MDVTQSLDLPGEPCRLRSQIALTKQNRQGKGTDYFPSTPEAKDKFSTQIFQMFIRDAIFKGPNSMPNPNITTTNRSYC